MKQTIYISPYDITVDAAKLHLVFTDLNYSTIRCTMAVRAFHPMLPLSYAVSIVRLVERLNKPTEINIPNSIEMNIYLDSADNKDVEPNF